MTCREAVLSALSARPNMTQRENVDLLRRLDEWKKGENPGPLIRWSAAHLRGCINEERGDEPRVERMAKTETIDFVCDDPECPSGPIGKHYHAAVYVVDDPDDLDAEELHPNAPWNDTSD